MVELLLHTVNEFLLSIDVPLFPGNHLLRVVGGFRVRQRIGAGLKSGFALGFLCLGYGSRVRSALRLRHLALSMRLRHGDTRRSMQRTQVIVGPNLMRLGSSFLLPGSVLLIRLPRRVLTANHSCRTKYRTCEQHSAN